MRSRVAWKKTMRTMRVPAGETSGFGDCECADTCILTEDGDDIVIESDVSSCLATET